MSFTITFCRDKDPKLYRATVEILHYTDNLLKVLVKAGDKELYMDKYLYRKTNQWKIARMSFNFSGDSKRNAMLILEIQKQIDAALVKKKRFI
jgi:predicted GTPase